MQSFVCFHPSFSSLVLCCCCCCWFFCCPLASSFSLSVTPSHTFGYLDALFSWVLFAHLFPILGGALFFLGGGGESKGMGCEGWREREVERRIAGGWKEVEWDHCIRGGGGEGQEGGGRKLEGGGVKEGARGRGEVKINRGGKCEGQLNQSSKSVQNTCVVGWDRGREVRIFAACVCVRVRTTIANRQAFFCNPKENGTPPRECDKLPPHTHTHTQNTPEEE